MPTLRPRFPSPDRIAVENFIGALFRYAAPDTYISLRAFHDLEDGPPLFIEAVAVGNPQLVERACARIAEAATHPEPHVFCPPVCTFKTSDSAKAEALAEGVALTVECDEQPQAALAKLAALLGPPTVIVASGGIWINPETSKPEAKIHLHWRLARPASDAEGHALLREARDLAAALVGADRSAVAIVHPLRWPGSWHRKAEPRIARLKLNPETEIEIGDALARLREASPPAPDGGAKHSHASTGKVADDVLDVVAALAVIPNGNLPWDDWNRIGMAAWLASSGSAFAAFDDWSRKSSKYDAKTTADRWAHYSTSPPDRIGAGTLFHLATDADPDWRRRTDYGRAKRADNTAASGGNNGATKDGEPPIPQWRTDMISARELCAMEFAPLKFIVPKIIPEGLTILAGRPKIGKSWLVLLLGIVLANGVKALGLDYETRMPLKGSVLYLGLEDGRRRLQRRMTKLIGARPENWPEQLYLKTKWRRFDQGGLDDIRAWYDHSKSLGETPVLVVVDTLAKIRAPGSSKASPYQNDHDALAGLQVLAEELGLAVVVNHHDRKMDADDIFDTVSGTLGLTGAVDTILVLTRKSQATALHIRGRDIEDETSLAMQFNKEDGRWSVTGTIAERDEQQRSVERARIIAALESAPEGLGVPEIMVVADLSNRNATDLLLFKMASDGQVERVKRGLYGLPGLRSRMAAAARARAKDGKKERSAEKPQSTQEDSNLSQSFPSFPETPMAGPAEGGNPLGTQAKEERSFHLSGAKTTRERLDGDVNPLKTQGNGEPSFLLSDPSPAPDPPETAGNGDASRGGNGGRPYMLSADPRAMVEVAPEPIRNGRPYVLSADPAAMQQWGTVCNLDGNGSAMVWPRAISDTPEDRREPEPGMVFVGVEIREIRPPGISAGPDDSLDDLVVF